MASKRECYYIPRKRGSSQPRNLVPLSNKLPLYPALRPDLNENKNTEDGSSNRDTFEYMRKAIPSVPKQDIDRDRWRKESKLLKNKTGTEKVIAGLMKLQ